MELIEGIETRRSCRAYKPDPVPEETVRKILETAKWSPSFGDSQPWEVAVVSGSKKDELIKVLAGLAEAGTPSNPDIPMPKAWPPEVAERMKEHYAHHSAYLGREPGADRQRRGPGRRGPDFYGAPCAVFLFMDKTLTEWSVFDMGLFAQSLILAAHSWGVGSCLQAMMVPYPDAIKEFLGIPETKKLVLGISLGYPDTGSGEYAYKSERIDLDEFVKWYS